MDINAIQKVSVLGGGTMGKQIALNSAIHGFDTWVYVRREEVQKQVSAWAEDYLAKRVLKGKMTQEQVDAAKNNFHVEGDLAKSVENAQLVIEAVAEDEAIKRDLFQKVAAVVSEDAIITTNSSVMPSSIFADSIPNPSRLANLHFFNPALVMKLVEVVTGPHSSEETGDTLMEYCRRVGKQPARLRKEIDGFIVNRVSTAMLISALELVAKGIATPEDVDIAMENGLNHPMGAFKFMDFIGLDIFLVTLKERQKQGEEIPGFELVEAKVKAGELGKKTGKGWYTY